MAEEINFLELACLLKVTPNTVLERFGSAINASIFDASNIAGSLKQHGLIDFTAYYPGPNEIVVTDAGKKLIAEADAKSTEAYDKLDDAVLAQLSNGKRIPVELQNTLNIRPKDLALRLYKLSKQGYMIYELKSGGVDLLLTETGFLKVGTQPVIQKPRPPPQQTAPPPSPQAMGVPPMTGQAAPDTMQGQPMQGEMGAMQQPGRPGHANPNEPVKLHGKPLSKSKALPIVIIVIVIILLLAFAHLYLNIL